MGACRRTQVVGQAYRAGNTGAKTDAVVRTRHIVVHRLGNADNLHTFLMEPYTVTQGIIASNGDQVVDPQKFQVADHFSREIVFFLVVCIP